MELDSAASENAQKAKMDFSDMISKMSGAVQGVKEDGSIGKQDPKDFTLNISDLMSSMVAMLQPTQDGKGPLEGFISKESILELGQMVTKQGTEPTADQPSNTKSDVHPMVDMMKKMNMGNIGIHSASPEECDSSSVTPPSNSPECDGKSDQEHPAQIVLSGKEKTEEIDNEEISSPSGEVATKVDWNPLCLTRTNSKYGFLNKSSDSDLSLPEKQVVPAPVPAPVPVPATATATAPVTAPVPATVPAVEGKEISPPSIENKIIVPDARKEETSTKSKPTKSKPKKSTLPSMNPGQTSKVKSFISQTLSAIPKKDLEGIDQNSVMDSVRSVLDSIQNGNSKRKALLKNMKKAKKSKKLPEEKQLTNCILVRRYNKVKLLTYPEEFPESVLSKEDLSSDEHKNTRSSSSSCSVSSADPTVTEKEKEKEAVQEVSEACASDEVLKKTNFSEWAAKQLNKREGTVLTYEKAEINGIPDVTILYDGSSCEKRNDSLIMNASDATNSIRGNVLVIPPSETNCILLSNYISYKRKFVE